MKVNEIRIGCNFQLENGVLGCGIATIKNKYDLDVAFDLLESNSIKPIPLTEEWLLKFKFEHCGSYFKLNNVILYIDWNNKYRYQYNYGQRWIKYVHQLQSLYFVLTGEELTFKSE